MPGVAAPTAPADHVRPAAPSWSSAPAAPDVQPEADRPDGGRPAPVLPSPDRRRSTARARRTPPRTTRSTSRCTASAGCSVCPRPMPTCSASGSSGTSRSAPRNNDVRAQLNEEMDDYCRSWLEHRRADPQDDLLTVIAHGEIDGRADRSRARGRLRDADDHRRHRHDVVLDRFRAVALRPAPRSARRGSSAAPDDDLLWQTAIEEVLRYYAPVTMAREIVADTEIAGCPVRAGEQTLVTFPAANHDPRRSRRRTSSGSTAPSTVTSRSGSASTAASGRTWRGSS